MAQSLHIGLYGFSTNLPFGICAIYLYLKVLWKTFFRLEWHLVRGNLGFRDFHSLHFIWKTLGTPLKNYRGLEPCPHLQTFPGLLLWGNKNHQKVSGKP